MERSRIGGIDPTSLRTATVTGTGTTTLSKIDKGNVMTEDKKTVVEALERLLADSYTLYPLCFLLNHHGRAVGSLLLLIIARTDLCR